MIVAILTQPAADSINAAYRAIRLRIEAKNSDGSAKPPIVYCDIYLNGTFYRTLSHTRYNKLNGTTDTEWEFDIQDAIQEYLQKMIADNGFQLVTEDTISITSVYCRFRASGTDSNGFIVPEGVTPVQATDDTAAIAGNGYLSNTFYAVNATLQHEDNQDLAAHLSTFKHRTWDTTTYPLTHRPDHYRIDDVDSDSFPILTDKTPGILILHYQTRGSAIWQVDSINLACDPVSILDDPANSLPPDLPNATQDIPYFYVIYLGGSAPFTLSSVVKPGWMTITVVGNTIVFGGTPTSGDVATGVNVSFDVKNCCATETASFADTLDVDAATGSGVDFHFGNDLFSICSGAPSTAYWSGTLGVGVILYSDALHTTPYTGFDYTRRSGSATVYTLNNITGAVTGTAVDVC